MGSLFFNKVAGALLAIFLIVLGLSTLADGIYHTEGPETPAYPVDLAALQPAAAEEEEEAPADFAVLLAGADIGAGERVARRCASCHTFEEGAGNGTGPALWDVIGRDVAEVSGFNYSQAMREYAEGGTEWMFENMSDYLESPRNYVPGTAMSFAGLRDQDDRVNLIAYMRTLSNDPVPMPEPAESDAPAESEGDAASADSEGEGEGDAAADAESDDGDSEPIPDDGEAEPQDG